MKRIMPIISIFFVLLLFVISSRFVLFISFEKSQKSEFRKQLIESSTVKLNRIFLSNDQIFKNTNGFEWKDKNKELVIKGVYHEVISVIKTNKGYLVTLIEDKLENELFKCYFNINQETKNSLKDMSTLLLGINYLENSSEFKVKRFYKKINHLPFICLFNNNSFVESLLKPPGQFLIS